MLAFMAASAGEGSSSLADFCYSVISGSAVQHKDYSCSSFHYQREMDEHLTKSAIEPSSGGAVF